MSSRLSPDEGRHGRLVQSHVPLDRRQDPRARLYCVLALAVARLMRREAAQAGLDMSVRELLSALGEIQETLLLYQGDRGRPRARRMLTEMDPPKNASSTLWPL